jgi:mRNA-degrading endonuclease RelE of RelBE toxin-antitoxin system
MRKQHYRTCRRWRSVNTPLEPCHDTGDRSQEQEHALHCRQRPEIWVWQPRPRARRMIIDSLEIHLSHQPTDKSRRIKEMRPNPVAGWELRLGDYRVLYDADDQRRVVQVQVIGEKVGNRLIVQGEEYSDHEGDRPERGEGES